MLTNIYININSIPLEIYQTQFVPDDIEGIVIQYELKNNGTKDLEIGFKFAGNTDLRPTWLAGSLKIVDGKDFAQFPLENKAWYVKDNLNSWSTIFGADVIPMKYTEEVNLFKGNGVANTLEYKILINAGTSKLITFFIAGSYNSGEEALKTFQTLKSKSNELFIQKKKRYEQLALNSKIDIPDKKLQEAFEWLKYNCDWLVREVPEIGTGIGAGIPDYPWWFAVDSEYVLKGYMDIGQTEAVYKTISLLDSISNTTNGNGRIAHEISTNGVVFNKGNINETPQFASLIWEIFRWNGDKSFLKQ